MCCGEKRKALDVANKETVYFKYRKSIPTVIVGKNGFQYSFLFEGDIQPVLKEDAPRMKRFWYLQEVAKPN